MQIEHTFNLDVHVSDEGNGPEIMSVELNGDDVIDILTDSDLSEILKECEEEGRK